MRIYVKSGRIRLFFGLPLSALKSRLASRIITDAVESKSNSDKNYRQLDEINGSVDKTAPCETCDLDVTVDVDKQRAELCESSQAELPDGAKADFVAHREFLKKIYDALKQVVKENGHFTLVDISADDGKTKVKIRI